MEDEWRFVCVICGYHVYKDVWDSYLGDCFTTKYERNNPHNKYAVAVLPVCYKYAVAVLPRSSYWPLHWLFSAISGFE